MGHENFYPVGRKGGVRREKAGKGTRARTDQRPLLLVGRIRYVIVHMTGLLESHVTRVASLLILVFVRSLFRLTDRTVENRRIEADRISRSILPRTCARFRPERVN